MSEFLSETQGCDLLTRLFRSRGYSIIRNLPFREYGVDFHIDGWDAKARVGFEFLTSEDEDHDDLSLSEYKTLSDAQQRGELALFIIDEVEPLSSDDLTAQANEFLDEVAAAVRAQSTSRGRSPGKAAKKKSAKKAATKTAKKTGPDAKAAPRKATKPAAAKATKRPTGKAAKKAVKRGVKKAAKKKARRAK
jgi:hypothetical protein